MKLNIRTARKVVGALAKSMRIRTEEAAQGVIDDHPEIADWVVGGVNGGMKRYVDVLDWRRKHWEYNEPCLTYQSPCAAMLIYYGLKLK